MRPLYRIRTFAVGALFALTLVVSCSDKQDAPPEKTVDADVFEKVSPRAFDDVDDAEVKLALEIKEKAGTLYAENRPAGLAGKFFSHGNFIELLDVDHGIELEISFDSVQREKAARHQALGLDSASRSADGNIVRRRKGGFEEYFVNRPEGIEHGLVIATKPEGDGNLLVGVKLGGGFHAATLSAHEAEFRHPAVASVHYRDLLVYDADGRHLVARMRKGKKGLRDLIIDIDDRDATYPIVVDPVLTRERERIWPRAIRTNWTAGSPSVQPGTCPISYPGFIGVHCGYGFSTAMYGDVLLVGDPIKKVVDVYVKDDQFGTCTSDADCQSGESCSVAVPGFTADRCLPGGASSQRWYLKRTIATPASGTWDRFGWSVAIAVVGTERYGIAVGDPMAASGEGRVVYYEIDRADLLKNVPEAVDFNEKIIADGGGQIYPNGFISAGDEFGADVSLSSRYIVIGAPGSNSDTGRVVIVENTGGGNLTPYHVMNPTSSTGVRLGSSVSNDNRWVIAGAPKPSDQIAEYRITFTPDFGFLGNGDSITISVGGESATATFDGAETMNSQIQDDLLNMSFPSFTVTAGGSDNEVIITANSPGLAGEPTFTYGGMPLTATYTVIQAASSPPSASVLDLDSTSSPLQEFAPFANDSKFGYDVHTHGNRFIAGAPGHSSGGVPNSGAVAAWDIDPGTSVAGSLDTQEAADGQNWGWTVFTSGPGGSDVAGAPFYDTSLSLQRNGRIARRGGFETAIADDIGIYQHNRGGAGGRRLGYAMAWDPTSTASDPTYVATTPGLAYDTWEAGDTLPQGGFAVFRSGNLRFLGEPQADLDGIEFGSRVDIAGDIMVVSAPGLNSPADADPGTGVVYVYKRSGEYWNLIEVIEPTDFEVVAEVFPNPPVTFPIVRLGPAVATNGTYIAIEGSIDNGPKSRVILFYNVASNGVTRELLTGNPRGGFIARYAGATELNLGKMVLDWKGNYLAAGFETHDTVQIYNTTMISTAFKQAEWLPSPANIRFGASVSVDPVSNVVAIGAPEDGTTGAVHFYNFATMAFASKLPDPSTIDAGTLNLEPAGMFGEAVAMDNGHVIIGAPKSPTRAADSSISASDEGSVYFVRWDSSTFAPTLGYNSGLVPFQVFKNEQVIVFGGNLPGSLMGSRVDLEERSGTGVAVANDWSDQVSVSFRYVSSADVWNMNDFAVAQDTVNDVAGGGNYPEWLALDRNPLTLPRWVAAGSPQSAFPASAALNPITGSIVRLPVLSSVPAEIACDGIDNNLNGTIDEGSCPTLGSLAEGCNLLTQTCFTSCIPPLPPLIADTCPAGSFCSDSLGLLLPVCLPEASCDPATEIQRNGECLSKCDPTDPAFVCPNAGEVCFDIPTESDPTLGACAFPDICTHPAFECPSTDQSCDQGACYANCLGGGFNATECNMTVGQCKDFGSFNACYYDDPCANIWCQAGTQCYQGACLTVCDGDPLTDDVADGVCAAGDACYTDQGTSESYCLADTGACDTLNGVGCPPDVNGNQQVCVDGDCFEDVATGCPTAGTYADSATGACLPNDPCTDILCPEGDTCVDGGCLTPCVDDGECAGAGAGFVCIDGTCRDGADLCSGVKCPGNDKGCFNGQCFEACDSTTGDLACSAGTSCVGTVCLPADPCTVITCATGNTCLEGACVQTCDPTGADLCNAPTSCFQDPSTPDNEGVCLETSDPCSYIDSCPSTSGGTVRTCVGGTCRVQCNLDADCPGSRCDLTRFVCLDPDPCASTFCPAGETCMEGSCFETCDPSTDPAVCVGVGTTCYADPTTPANEGVCLDNTDPCAGITCPPEVGTNERQTCVQGECVPICNPTNNSCPAPESCRDGGCIAADPCNDVLCPAGDLCTDGYCYTPCVPGNGDCAGTEACFVDPLSPTNGRCAPDVADPCAGITCPPDSDGNPQLCYEGSCFRECVDDNDCEPPNICFNSVNGLICNAPDPCDGVWCPVGDVCFAGSCFEDCGGSCSGTCYDNNDGSDRCSTTSCDGVLCPVGEVCMNGVCGAPCSTDGDCTDSHICEGACAIDVAGSDCDQGGTGRCLPNDCSTVNCPAGQTCTSGICGDNCTNDSQCNTGAGEICYDGACIADPCDPDPCDPSTQVCYGGACYSQCAIDDECTGGRVCTGGRCTDSPCAGVDCPVGQVCYEGSCFDPCVNDGDCTPPNLCFNNVCAADPCVGVSCPVGEVCYGGSCAPPCGTTTACQDDTFCSGGETCQNINPTTLWGYCTDCGAQECWVSGCASDADCAGTDYCFKNGTSLSGACMPAGCDPTASPECNSGVLSCRTGACDGVQCPVGQVCYEGSCFDPCTDNGDCTPPNLCYDGVCTNDLCRGVNCPVGQVCYAGSCFDPCIGDDDCTPPNDLCFDGRCAADACAGVNCPVGDVCIQGGCFEACTVNTDCSEFIGTGDFVEVSGSTGIQGSGSDKDGGMSWHDFNKDGCLDAAINGRGGENTRIYYSDCNLPNPSFTDITYYIADHFGNEEAERSIVGGDFNGDGLADLVRTDSNDVYVYINRGPNGYQWPSGPSGYGAYSWGVGGLNEPNQEWSGNYEGAGVLDFDGDKDLDFMAQEDDRVRLYRNQGFNTANFNEESPEVFHDHNEDGDYCAVADYDVDGDVDILCRFEDNARDLFRNDGGTFTAVNHVNEDGDGGDKSGVVFCDYDNDGDFDLFWGGKGTNQWWNQPSTGDWTETDQPDPTSGFDLNQGNREIEGVDCGDIDNDGDMDLFIAHKDEHRMFINQLIETGTPSWVLDNRGITPGDGGEQGTFADYDNDGDLDIILMQDSGGNLLYRNPLTGSDYIMVRPRVDLGGGVFRDAIGATITIEDADGNVLGVREANGGSGRGSQRPTPVHIGLQNGDNVPYLFRVRFPHSSGDVVERCIIPNTMTGYRVLNIDHNDSDDISACNDANWRDNIITPNSGEYCFEDHCAANACDGIQCSSAFICVGGSCVPTCTSDSQCAADEICYQGRCANALDPACDKVKCPSNQTCYAGECFKDCASGSDCDGNQYCYQGRCADPTCNKISGNCLIGESCHLGTCYRNCTTNAECPAGESCWDGRCATDSCAAMMDTYEATHTFKVTGRKLTADQYSRPYFWPRPIVGPSGTPIAAYAVDDGVGSSTVGGVHQTDRARIVMYLDRTLSDGDNPEGRYVLWLTHGRKAAGQGAARANYMIRLKHSGNAALDTQYIDDGNEARRHLIDGTEEIVVAQISSVAGTTGGIALGPLPARVNDWTITVDAAFSGAINTWEFYNPELNNATNLKQTEQVTIRGLPMSPDIVLAPEVGLGCTMAVDALTEGNCSNGVLACSVGNFGLTRCDQAVFPAGFEICDGEDNNCINGVDEVTAMRVPYVQFNQNDGWKYWVPADSNNDFFADLNYTPRGTDDRLGSTNYVGLEGTPMQGVQKSLVYQHRDLLEGDLTVGFLHGAIGAASARNVRMELDYPGDGTAGSQSFRDAFIAYYDDGTPAADAIPDSFDAANFALQLNWDMTVDATANRESDGIAIRPNFHQYATGRFSYFDIEFEGIDDDNDDWTDDGLQWVMYQPKLTPPANENNLLKSRELDMRLSGVAMPFTFCPAAVPVTVTDPTTGITETCELGRYTCNLGGTLSCGSATVGACDICFDNDADGFPLYDPALCPDGTDCNDEDPQIYPGAPERCNGLDDDCDTQIDIKSDPTICPGGAAECGPTECNFKNICVCPDGPENPNDPPSEPCYCSEGLEPGGDPAEPTAPDDAALFEDRAAGCMTAPGTPLETDMPWWIALGIAGLALRRRRRS